MDKPRIISPFEPPQPQRVGGDDTPPSAPPGVVTAAEAQADAGADAEDRSARRAAIAIAAAIGVGVAGPAVAQTPFATSQSQPVPPHTDFPAEQTCHVVVELHESPADPAARAELLKQLQAAGTATVSARDTAIEIAGVILRELPAYGGLILSYLAFRKKSGETDSKGDAGTVRVRVGFYALEGSAETEDDCARTIAAMAAISEGRRPASLRFTFGR